jgi:Na+/H+-dicarboxylate symporter
VLAIVQKVLWWVILLAPLGTVGLIGNAVATYGWQSLGSLGVFAASVYAGLVLVLFVVYPVLLRSHGLSPRRFFAGAWPAIQLGFVSRSSIGTLPVTERVTEQNLGVPRSYASFAVPLGATTKMDGCAAIYPALSAIFVAQFFHVHLGLTDYLLIALVSVVGSAATAGVTGAVVMLTLTLSTLGLPLAGVGLLLAIDPILDMGRTAINVAGQALVPTIVAKREGILDVERYNATSTIDPLARAEEQGGIDADLRRPEPALV